MWTQFGYDALGRTTLERHPDATTRTWAFAPGLVTLTDERGSVKRQYQDGYGRLSRVEEVNGGATYATTYAYDGAGSLLQVTNHVGHVTTNTVSRAVSYETGRVPGLVEKRNGTVFRLVKCTTNTPPARAATGGTRHGQRYQQVGRSA